jgi:dUTP pyrophosphatase
MGSSGAAGFDLYSDDTADVLPRSQQLISTGISIKLPDRTYGRVASRSGLAVKNGIHVGAGVIDQDYRGEIKVLLYNLSDETFKVKPGDRIAQLICERYESPEVILVAALDDTTRGEGGFGSTGTN